MVSRVDFPIFFDKLKIAVESNQIETVRKLISNIFVYCPKLTKTHYYRVRFLLLLATNCDEGLINLFLDFFKLKDKNQVPIQLQVAVLGGNLKKVENLLKNGAKLAGQKWNGNSPATYGFCRWNMNNRKKMLELLVEHGLDTGFKQEPNQNVLDQFLRYFVNIGDSDAVEIAEILFNSLTSANKVNVETLSSFLVSSICSQHIGLVSFFLNKGANVNDKNDWGLFPLWHAAQFNDDAIANILLSRGANVNDKDFKGWTALHEACLNHNDRVIASLLRRGARVSEKDDSGMTPMFYLNPELESYGKCAAVLTKEFSKLAFEDVPIEPSDMGVIKSDPVAREIFDECAEELESMAGTKFHKSLTYYSVLKTSRNLKRLARVLNNEDLVKEFRENLNKFPRYQSDLENVLEEGIRERENSIIVISRLNSVFGGFLPDLVIRVLAENLAVEDLPL